MERKLGQNRLAVAQMITFTRKTSNKTDNLIVRNGCYLILSNDKFYMKQDYENIIPHVPTAIPLPKLVAPLKTDIPSKVAPSVKSKSRRVIKKPKEHLERC